jgi:hypothetical protein
MRSRTSLELLFISDYTGTLIATSLALYRLETEDVISHRLRYSVLTTDFDSSIPIQITLAESVVKDDVLGYSSGWKRALATASSVIQARCVAAMDGKSGDKIIAYFGKTRVSGRISGATVGAEVYVAEGTSYGQYTETAPSTSGDATKIVGVAISATEIMTDPNAYADSVHA